VATSTIAPAVYVTATGKRVVILRVFAKKTLAPENSAWPPAPIDANWFPRSCPSRSTFDADLVKRAATIATGIAVTAI